MHIIYYNNIKGVKSMYNMYNPFMPPAPAPYQGQVVTVNGNNGANAFSMGPNASVILLDESGKIAWFVKTDGAGYKSVAPFDLTPHQEAPAPDYSGLENRIKKLEEMIAHERSGVSKQLAIPGDDE